MSDMYFIGKLVLYAVDNNPASIGEIVEIMEEGRSGFTVREPANVTKMAGSITLSQMTRL